ncbi:MAG: PH domain-containing protein [Clostridia bacterium]
MIDFQNANYLKLKPVSNSDGESLVSKMLVNNEEIFASFKTIRDMVIFTNKRVISINVQGMTGKKKDFTSLPYSKIQAFSVETAGTFDLDSELELWFSGLGKVKFEFVSGFDITEFNKYISNYVL